MEKLLELINRSAVSGTPRLVSSQGRKHMLGREIKRALIDRGRLHIPSWLCIASMLWTGPDRADLRYAVGGTDVIVHDPSARVAGAEPGAPWLRAGCGSAASDSPSHAV